MMCVLMQGSNIIYSLVNPFFLYKIVVPGSIDFTNVLT